jgi:hypothetical protein
MARAVCSSAPLSGAAPFVRNASSGREKRVRDMLRPANLSDGGNCAMRAYALPHVCSRAAVVRGEAALNHVPHQIATGARKVTEVSIQICMVLLQRVKRGKGLCGALTIGERKETNGRGAGNVEGSCRPGSAKAQNNLSCIYDQERGVTQSDAEATRGNEWPQSRGVLHRNLIWG